VVRTKWDSADIWMRRTFELGENVPVEDLQLLLHHDDEAEVYINGVQACKVRHFTTDYAEQPISKEAKKALKPGKNTFAVHCHQIGGGQYIDVGIVRVVERKPTTTAATR